MSGKRPRLVRIGAALLLPVPFLLAAFAAGEIYVRALGPDRAPPFINCLQYDPDVRHRYRENCRWSAPSAQGSILYSFNEDGLRDRPRAAFARGAVVVLGDSIAEGLFLRDLQTIPRRLEEKTGTAFLNAAIQFSSPSLQRLYFEKLVEPHYPVRAVLWLLNASDPTDERLFHAEAIEHDADGLPTKFAWFGSWSTGTLWLTRLNQWSKDRSRLVTTLVRLATFGVYYGKIESVPPSKEVLCGAVHRLAGRLREKQVPLLIAFTPHYEQGIEDNWGGLPYHPDELARLEDCARASGAPVVDLSKETLQPDWFVADRIHYSPAGAAWVASRLAPEVSRLLSAPSSPPESAAPARPPRSPRKGGGPRAKGARRRGEAGPTW